jgi:hypothetical protein
MLKKNGVKNFWGFLPNLVEIQAWNYEKGGIALGRGVKIGIYELDLFLESLGRVQWRFNFWDWY